MRTKYHKILISTLSAYGEKIMDANKLKKIDELKKEIDIYRPLSKQELEELKAYYRIGLTYTNNALEGNSLTESETKIVLEEGITIGGKLIKDHLEALGSSDAYDLLYKLAKQSGIEEKDILKLQKLFYFRIDPKQAGKYRKTQVFITGTEFIPPAAKEIPYLMKSFVAEIPELQKKYHPVEYAALLHLRLVTIHPFIDGNGRCARLLMNLALIKAGYPITIIPPVVRREYIDVLRTAQTSKKDVPFFDFISTMAIESEQEFLRLVKALRK